ncbi:transcription initiation factor TFIIA small subunit, partial [Catenaria anguillulae PL171]
MADNNTFFHYRNTTIGQTLTDALDDMIQAGTLQAPIANRVLTHFDRHIGTELAKLSTRGSFRAHLSTYRNCDDVWTFILRDVNFRLMGNEQVQADRVKIIACKRPEGS